MKISRASNSFGSQTRRRSRSPLSLIPAILILVVVALLALAWSRGGEQPQKPVEKAVPAEKLGK